MPSSTVLIQSAKKKLLSLLPYNVKLNLAITTKQFIDPDAWSKRLFYLLKNKKLLRTEEAKQHIRQELFSYI